MGSEKTTKLIELLSESTIQDRLVHYTQSATHLQMPIRVLPHSKAKSLPYTFGLVEDASYEGSYDKDNRINFNFGGQIKLVPINRINGFLHARTKNQISGVIVEIAYDLQKEEFGGEPKDYFGRQILEGVIAAFEHLRDAVPQPDVLFRALKLPAETGNKMKLSYAQEVFSKHYRNLPILKVNDNLWQLPP